MTSNAPTSFVRAYLRASTAEQDASRALETIEAFARERGLIICSYYIENESGSRLDRPELFRLLRDCQQNDILLVEDVDRLSRLTGEDWNKLKKMIRQKDIRVMAVNVPTTWINSGMSEFDSRLFAAINDMLLDMLAAVARRDYEQRRERQKQGIEKARKDGKYKGRKPNQARYDAINRLIESGSSWSQVQKVLGCSRGTISKAVRQSKLCRQPPAPEPGTRLSAILWVPVANGSKFTRGKKKVKEEIAWLIEADFDGEVLENNEYRLFFTYEDEEDLKEQIDDLFREINLFADMRNCVVDDMILTNERTGKSWNEYDGGWY